MQKVEVAVVGSGSWATAIVKILLNNVEKVHWWVREREIAEHLMQYGHNPRYLSSVSFDTKRLNVSHELNRVLNKADIPVFCIPAAFLERSLEGMHASLLRDKPVVSAIKGIVPGHNQLVTEFFHTRYDIPYKQCVIVSGPSHAEEVAQEKLTYLTIATQSRVNGAAVSGLFSSRYIKTDISNDLFGAEYGPVLKNIIAIASGICSGLGYGDNFHAVLISNALQEISLFLETVKPAERDISKSVYLGDLLVTCYSQFSRNRRFGQMLARGYSPEEAQMEMSMVAEGYYASKCVQEMNAPFGLELPIINAVYNILYNKAKPVSEIRALEDKLA
ncbi:MAG: NAD(P)H-dependent glycerol-3-phosphate dehydrogenase [Bacteroidia bacterium]|nr:MAG: NAD(P)H-dependent glycerol-3-phosphate dehydrogenase [Bacteroidia bacterium]